MNHIHNQIKCNSITFYSIDYNDAALPFITLKTNVDTQILVNFNDMWISKIWCSSFKIPDVCS